MVYHGRGAGAGWPPMHPLNRVTSMGVTKEVFAGRFIWVEAGVMDPSGGGPFLAAERQKAAPARPAVDVFAAG
ncbi:hypothetical protein Franean1_2525 [Parafrankia sp. EAN1pec]|nr:hypothetical protein Franean1_2525 [Frankia sp. EAN1pec]